MGGTASRWRWHGGRSARTGVALAASVPLGNDLSMPPAARVGDMHVCPMATPGTPPIPHVGGPILPPGAPTVLIGKMPAATIGSMCTCVGPPDTITGGSPKVMISGKPAARMGDLTAHGGTIVAGFPMVMIN